ncbi:6588_t:CDS:2, partial [Dentiscutata erythropus]
FVTDYKLTTEISLEELSRHAPEMLELLTDNKERRRQAQNRAMQKSSTLKEGRLEAEEVNICQVSDSSEETIKETAQHIMKDKLSERDIKAISRTLVKTAPNPVHSEQHENEGIDFPDYFSLESVKERLDGYDISNIPDKQALADVMIMLCIRPAEIKNLCISNGAVTGYAKNRGSNHFRELRDPGKLGSTYLSTFLKKDEFLPES